MPRVSAVVLAAAVTVLAGCGTWTHPTKPASALEADRAHCQRESVAMFPVVIAQRLDRPGRIEPGRSSCTTTGNTTNCVNYPPREIPPTYVSYDANESRRNDAQNQCLRAAGWVYKLD